MECEIVTVQPEENRKKDKSFKRICSLLEKSITKENLSVNGGTLNYSNLTYDSDILLLATMNNRAIGYASLVFLKDSIYVYQIAVKKDYQQKGIGRSLMTKTIDIASQLGMDVTANVMDYNTNSKKMFTQLGFTKLGYSKPNDGFYRLYQKDKEYIPKS